MLKILWGEDRIRNRQRILRQICGAGETGSKQILIVPEQASFETERLLCTLGGSRVCRYAEVLSFTRLANRVFSVCGGVAIQTLEKPARVLAMAQAVQQIRYRLKLYAAGTGRPAFLLQLLAAVEEFKNYAVGAKQLRQAAQKQEGILAQKLEELALIMDSYNAVCQAGQADPADRMTLLAQALHDGAFVQGKTFYIDGFLDFTGTELEVMQQLLYAGADVTVSLCCDGLMQGAPVFEPVRRTARELQRRAALVHRKVIAEQIAAEADTEIAYAARALFRNTAAPYPDTSERIHLRVCTDEYEQAQELAAGILHLIRLGYRFSDIAVAAADLDLCRTVYEDVFARYEIPVHFAVRQQVLQSPVYEMVLNALEAAQTMERDAVLAWLKSGYAPLEPEQCDAFENYAVLWNISGFSTPWTRHPRGFGVPFTPEDEQRLAALEQLRQTALAPLFRLREGCADAQTLGQMVQALIDFFDQIDLAGRLSEQARAQYEQGSLQDAQQTAQLYEMLLDALEQMYGLLSGLACDGQTFLQLLQVVLSQYQVGTVPASMDCVVCAGIEQLRVQTPRVLFLTGCNEGLFPANDAAPSLLSDRERRRLTDAGLALAPDTAEKLARNLADIRLTLAGAQEHLFLFTSDPQPSYLFLRLQGLFERRDERFEARQYPAAFSSPAALAQAAARESAPPEIVQAAALLNDPALERQRRGITERAQFRPGELSGQSVRGLYPKRLFLSASQIQTFAGCRQAHFLRYALKLKPRTPATFDAPVYGTFVHEVLERTLRQVRAEGGFAALPQARVLEIAEGCLQQLRTVYAADFLPQGERFLYLLNRNCAEVRQIMRDLDAELRQSRFVPARFELGFGSETAMGPVRIDAPGGTAYLTGFVDRVDLYRDGGKTYVRVVDYKTGKKDFDYADLLNAMGLQMLLYLFALEENGEREFQTPLKAAGVLYVPTRFEMLSLRTEPTQENILAARLRTKRRKGLLVNDERLLYAMEPCQGDPVYLPYQQTKDGPAGDLATPGQMELLRRHVRREVTRIAQEMFSGKILPNPYERGKSGACVWCEYRDCCHWDVYGGQMRQLRALDAAEFWQELARREEKDGRD